MFEIVFSEKEFLFCLITECYVSKIHLAKKKFYKHATGRQLSDLEKQRISDFKSLGLTQREIAKRINRSQSVVKNFLKLGPQKYGKKKTFRKAKKKLVIHKKELFLEKCPRLVPHHR